MIKIHKRRDKTVCYRYKGMKKKDSVENTALYIYLLIKNKLIEKCIYLVMHSIYIKTNSYTYMHVNFKVI